MKIPAIQQDQHSFLEMRRGGDNSNKELAFSSRRI